MKKAVSHILALFIPVMLYAQQDIIILKKADINTLQNLSAICEQYVAEGKDSINLSDYIPKDITTENAIVQYIPKGYPDNYLFEDGKICFNGMKEHHNYFRYEHYFWDMYDEKNGIEFVIKMPYFDAAFCDIDLEAKEMFLKFRLEKKDNTIYLLQDYILPDIKETTIQLPQAPNWAKETFKIIGFTVPTYYEVLSQYSKNKLKAAILTPRPMACNNDSLYHEGPFSDRLLLINYNDKKMVYDNVISNAELSPGGLGEDFASTDSTEDYEDSQTLCIEFLGGNAYKIHYLLNINVDENGAYLSAITFDEHNGDLSFQRETICYTDYFKENSKSNSCLKYYNRQMPARVREGIGLSFPE